MKTFIGTKIVKATPMNRAEYNEYRGWSLPANEDGADEGCLVEYTDGGKPNDSRHAGYISWSPKEQFDKAYFELDEDSEGNPIAGAFRTIRTAFAGDMDYAWAWHCNIAMAAYDAGCPHDVANEGAARFMRMVFNADTRKHVSFVDTQNPGKGLTFGQAIEALKIGKKVTRAGWNGTGMWVTIAGPISGKAVSHDKFWSQNNAQFAYDQPNGEAIVRPYFTIKTANDEISSWVPSVGDCLAKDWKTV